MTYSCPNYTVLNYTIFPFYSSNRISSSNLPMDVFIFVYLKKNPRPVVLQKQRHCVSYARHKHTRKTYNIRPCMLCAKKKNFQRRSKRCVFNESTLVEQPSTQYNGRVRVGVYMYRMNIGCVKYKTRACVRSCTGYTVKPLCARGIESIQH